MKPKVLDVWFDNKGNPRVTVEHTKEEEHKIDISDKEMR